MTRSISSPVPLSASPSYATAYYDTIADLADTVVGSIAGVVVAVISKRRNPALEE